MANSARSKCHGALMFLDLDHFKDINDTQGHETGDKLLNEVARRLSSGVREGDTVSRLGGDEFVVILDSLDQDISVALSQASYIAEKIRTAVGNVYLFNEQEFEVGVSIGIVVFNNHDEDLNDLLKHADTAMYRAKNEGRNMVRFYDPQMQHILEARTNLLNDLRIAVRENQFELYYQVQAENLDVIHLYAAEVLIRWNQPLRGFVSPAEFIPLAEESGLILPIGLWVLETACRQLQIWKTTPKLKYIRLSVNVSARQFREKDFLLTIKNLIHKYEIDASMLKLELTESMVINDIDGCIDKMHEIKKLGVSFSLDDFGTGYSSLTYLKRLPLDQIKIDQSFVREIISNGSDAAIVGAIIAIGQAMGVSIIAEGVETYAQQKFMEDHGCHQFQGYLFSKPLPVGDFEKLIRDC
jgi:diguanylate cyclase (GGDEF)-like protein